MPRPGAKGLAVGSANGFRCVRSYGRTSASLGVFVVLLPDPRKLIPGRRTERACPGWAAPWAAPRPAPTFLRYMRKGWLQIPHPGAIPFSRELFLLLPAALLRERYRTAFPRTRAIRFSP